MYKLLYSPETYVADAHTLIQAKVGSFEHISIGHIVLYIQIRNPGAMWELSFSHIPPGHRFVVVVFVTITIKFRRRRVAVATSTAQKCNACAFSPWRCSHYWVSRITLRGLGGGDQQKRVTQRGTTTANKIHLNKTGWGTEPERDFSLYCVLYCPLSQV